MPVVMIYFFSQLTCYLVPLLSLGRQGQKTTEWSEVGDRFMLKLFRDFVFHQIDQRGAAYLDLAHIVTVMNKVRCHVFKEIKPRSFKLPQYKEPHLKIQLLLLSKEITKNSLRPSRASPGRVMVVGANVGQMMVKCDLHY